ncbi:MAG: Ribose 5-phosphate isomerase B (EC [uncultured Campylobacterales bacterium]|uniref:Ribose 5-phosphate isomerase B (EC) n=1 Tax=uncultured Campylobacterales bacterium TaxID=352960 RepID=A0A6S6SBV2_9BACT|nr:MAG: Ribose 5-phosphate isomerase B (EC [uncultured Campylobacterales bacterium]
MKFFIGCDHGGYSVKSKVIQILESLGNEVKDLGTHSNQSVDYPDYAHKVCKSILSTPGSNGILICGTGIGMSITANRYKGIRAALCTDSYTASITKQHNNSNVLCFGQRVVGMGVIEDMLRAWCKSEFEAGRHQARVEKIENIT